MNSSRSALRRIALGLATLSLSAASVSAQPTGSVTFGGPGAPLVPSTTYVPATFAGEEATWSFLDASGAVAIVVIELGSNPGLAAFVSVAVEGGATWAQVGFGGVPGVTISGDTITFQSVTLPQGARTALADLTLDGSLTRAVVSVSPLGFGQVKARYHRPGR